MLATRACLVRAPQGLSHAVAHSASKGRGLGGGDVRLPRPRQGVRSNGRPGPHPPRDRPWREEQNVRMENGVKETEQRINNLHNRRGGTLLYKTVAAGDGTPGARLLDEICVGDFVQIQSTTGLESGVVLPASELRAALDSRANVSEFNMVTISGEVRSVFASAVLFCIPEFVDPKLAERARQILVEATVESVVDKENRETVASHVQEQKEKFGKDRFQARVTICSHLRALLQQTEYIRQALYQHFERLYLMERDGKQAKVDVPTANRTASEVARALLTAHGVSDGEGLEESVGRPAMLFATHQLMMSAPHVFRTDLVSHNSTNTFRILPEEEQKVLATVRRLVSVSLECINSSATAIEKVDPIFKFARWVDQVKTRRRDALRSSGSATENGPPSSQPFSLESINGSAGSNTRAILHFLRMALAERRAIRSEREIQLALYILKRCGYKLEIAPSDRQSSRYHMLELLSEQRLLLMAFFKDIGYLAPWDNQSSFITEFLENIEPANVKQPGPLRLKDDGHLRVDRHEEVFVIDDENAAELDDGISVERTDDPGVSWIHVHIADPTAGLDMDDPVAKDASKRFSSVYLPEGKWPMLPEEITGSLGLRPSGADRDRPLRAMTFSAKILHDTGKVADVDVSLSMLHKVRVMSYAQASEMMSNESGSNDQADLKLLHQVASSLFRRRTDVYGAIQYSVQDSVTNVEVSPLPLPRSPLRSTDFVSGSTDPQMFTGFPAIKFVSSGNGGDGAGMSASQMTVSEMALLAGRIAARFARTHNIPAIYRYQPSPKSDEENRRVLAMRNERGEIPLEQILKSNVVVGAAALSVRPAEHYLLGMRTRSAKKEASASAAAAEEDVLLNEGYLRITSPLRRYGDLMMHWQFRRALNGIHQTRKEGDGRGEPAIKHVFSEQDLYGLLAHVTRMERWHKALDRATIRSWKTQGLYNAWIARENGQAVVDEEAVKLVAATHTVMVIRSGARQHDDGSLRISVEIRGLGLPALCLLPPRLRGADFATVTSDPMLQIGSKFRVRIRGVQQTPGNTAIVVEPV